MYIHIYKERERERALSNALTSCSKTRNIDNAIDLHLDPNTGDCKINAHHERKRKPCTSPSISLELEQGSRGEASHDEIGRLFCTPLHSSSDRVEDRTQEERGRHEEGDA